MNRTLAVLACTLALITSSLGCGKDKADALLQIENVKRLCASGERTKALDTLTNAAEKNKTFAKSFHFVTADVPDKTLLDPCGRVPDRIKAHLEGE